MEKEKEFLSFLSPFLTFGLLTRFFPRWPNSLWPSRPARLRPLPLISLLGWPNTAGNRRCRAPPSCSVTDRPGPPVSAVPLLLQPQRPVKPVKQQPPPHYLGRGSVLSPRAQPQQKGAVTLRRTPSCLPTPVSHSPSAAEAATAAPRTPRSVVLPFVQTAVPEPPPPLFFPTVRPPCSPLSPHAIYFTFHGL